MEIGKKYLLATAILFIHGIMQNSVVGVMEQEKIGGCLKMRKQKRGNYFIGELQARLRLQRICGGQREQECINYGTYFV